MKYEEARHEAQKIVEVSGGQSTLSVVANQVLVDDIAHALVRWYYAGKIDSLAEIRERLLTGVR